MPAAALLALALGCAHAPAALKAVPPPAAASGPAAPPAAPSAGEETGSPPRAALPSAPPNFELSSYEVVEKEESDALAMVRVFVGGSLAGQTETAPLSKEKRWTGRLQPGNRPLRFERWVLRGTGPWAKAEDDFQPRERFYRIDDRSLIVVQLKFFDSGRQYVIQTTREEPAQKP